MNYYGPRQRQSDQRWDYTCKNDDRVWPVGYCHAYKEFDTSLFYVSEAEIAEHDATKHKHHTEGHATEEEACECYRQYLFDHHLRLNQRCQDTQHKCEICGAWTDLFAEIDMQIWHLCSEHNKMEIVDKLFEAPSEIWSS